MKRILVLPSWGISGLKDSWDTPTQGDFKGKAREIKTHAGFESTEPWGCPFVNLWADSLGDENEIDVNFDDFMYIMCGKEQFFITLKDLNVKRTGDSLPKGEYIYPVGPLRNVRGEPCIPIEGGGHVRREDVRPARDEDFFPGCLGLNPNMEVEVVCNSRRCQRKRWHRSHVLGKEIDATRKEQTAEYFYQSFMPIYDTWLAVCSLAIACQSVGLPCVPKVRASSAEMPDQCLHKALARLLDVPLAPVPKRGPFRALTDGNRFLSPHNKHLARAEWQKEKDTEPIEGTLAENHPGLLEEDYETVDCPEQLEKMDEMLVGADVAANVGVIIPPGKYIVFKDGHFRSVVVADDKVEIIYATVTWTATNKIFAELVTDAIVFELHDGADPGNHDMTDDVMGGMDDGLPASPYTRRMEESLESSAVPESQDTRADAGAGARVGGRPHPSRGLVQRAMAGRVAARIGLPADPRAPPIRAKSFQEVAAEKRRQIFDTFIADRWGPVNMYSEAVHDIVSAIAMVEHSVCSTMTGGKATLSDLLQVFLVRHGHVLRSHDKELFVYNTGVWSNIKEPPLMSMSAACTIAEGLYHTLGKTIPEADAWSWEKIQAQIKNSLAKFNNAENCKKAAIVEARLNWDRVKRDTGGRTYKADPLSKMADSVASKAKEYYEADMVHRSKKNESQLYRLYTSSCTTPMPKSKGWRCVDTYVDENWTPAADSPQNNCYTALHYNFEPDPAECPENMDLDDVRQFIDTFIRSSFWENDSYFEVVVASLYCALHRIETGVMTHAVGGGQDSKGSVGTLEANVLGRDNCTTLEPNVFIEPGEFRKSGHFAYNKLLVRINEAKSKSNFEFDIWKRFVVGEEIDIRCNFGQTAKVRFRGMKKHQDANPLDLPRVTSSSGTIAPTNLVRRIIAALVGKAKLVANQEDANPDEGIFWKIPQDKFEEILNNPVVATLFLREYLLPIWADYGDERLQAVMSWDSLAPELRVATDWLCERLCGLHNDPPPSDPSAGGDGQACTTEPSDEELDLLAQIHQHFSEMAPVAKAHQEKREFVVFPWRIGSNIQKFIKGGKAGDKVIKFKELLGRCGPLSKYLFTTTNALNYQGVDEEGWVIQPVDAKKFLEAYRGECESLRVSLLQLRDPSAKYQGYEELDFVFPEVEKKLQTTDEESFTLEELVNLEKLTDGVEQPGHYANPGQVRSYIQMVRKRGKQEGALWRVSRTYRKKNGKGRSYAPWLSLQWLEKKARTDALTTPVGEEPERRYHELDQHNAQPTHLAHHMAEILGGLEQVRQRFPYFYSFVRNAKAWRRFVQNYYGEDADPKKVLISVMFPKSRLCPPGREDKLPLVDTLHSEFMEIRRQLEESSPLYQEMKESRPDACPLSLVLGHLEDATSTAMMKGLREQACECPCVAFDGVYFASHDINEDTIQALMGKIHSDFGIETQVKDLRGDVVNTRHAKGSQKRPALAEAVDAIRERRKRAKVVDRVGAVMDLNHCAASSEEASPGIGIDTCSLDALGFLFEGVEIDLYSRLQDGPHTYRDIVDAAQGKVAFTSVAKDEVLIKGEYTLHFGSALQVGHAMAVEVNGDTARVFDSVQSKIYYIGAEALFAQKQSTNLQQ